MEIFSNKEKNELLIRIANAKGLYEAYSEAELAMIDEYLYPSGFVDIMSRLVMPGHYICEITNKGKAFLNKGGYEAIQKEQDENLAIENERIELIRLQKEELNYKKRIRELERIVLMQRVIEAILFFISLGFTIAYFCLKTKP